MKKALVIAGLILGTSTMLMAGAPAAFKKCAGCHGQTGEKVALGKSKVIKDMSKSDIEKALHGYKDGSYGGAMKGLMKGQVANLSDADITEIANAIGK